MEQIYNFLQLVQDVVLKPDLASAFTLLITSFVNELFAVLPYNIILSGQLLFLKEPLSLSLITKLLVFISIPVGVGTTLGSLPLYGLAYFGGKPTIDKFGKHLRFSWEDVEKMEAKFKGHWYDEVLFLALRSIPLLPTLPLNAAAGVFRMSPVSYIVLTAVGTVIRMMLLFMFVGLGMEGLAQ